MNVSNNTVITQPQYNFRKPDPSDHDVGCNGRVVLFIFPLIDSEGSEVYLTNLAENLSRNMSYQYHFMFAVNESCKTFLYLS